MSATSLAVRMAGVVVELMVWAGRLQLRRTAKLNSGAKFKFNHFSIVVQA
jgi:hypothetical protein